MPLIKIKVKHGEHTKVINLERTLPNPYGVFWGELIKKFNDADIDVYYEGKSKILINDDVSLKAAIEDCIAAKQPFLQLTAIDKEEEPEPVAPNPAPVSQPAPASQPTAPKPAPVSQPTAPKPAAQPTTPMSPANSVPASPSKPKFCQNCGAKFAGGKFCQECGAPVSGGAAPASPASQPTSQAPATHHEDVPDFDPQFACGKCGKMVAGGVKALGKYWHDDCFVCSICGNKFGGERRLMEVEGKPTCSLCYDETYAPRCFKCSKPLTGKYLVVDGHNYHSQCFVCTRCGKPFEGGQYLLVDGQPVCKKCV